VKRPGNLSENGFYYCGQSDTVKCFSCGGVISNWSAGDDVKTEHQKRYPDCLFVLGRANDVKFGAGNVVVKKEMAAASPGKDVFGSGAQQLNSLEDIQYSGFADRATDTQPRMSSFKATSDSILDELHSLSAVVPQEHDRADGTTNTSARNPSRAPSQTLTEVDLNLVKYENYRLKTFEGRWSENSFMSPIDLAKAGFYYYGSGDNVQCAFCRGRLLNWKPTDTAMSEHQRHYPNCPFLQPGSNVGNVTAENEEYNKVQMPQNQVNHLLANIPNIHLR
jgi:baculoviral IAP repeat-containing protein 2/3